MKNIKCKIIKISIVIFTILLAVSSYILMRDFLEYKESKDTNIQIIKIKINLKINKSDLFNKELT